MPIRDIVVTLTVLGLLPVCVLRPWIGIVVWSWFSYMNPHRLTWGFAYSMPFALMVGIATLVGFILARDRKPFVWNRETVTLILLWGWFTVTTALAIYPESAWTKWQDMSKILLMTLVGVPLLQDRRRLRILFLVIAGSIGFYGFKGGIFALATGGEWMILGPRSSFFAGNTELALALNMCLPIFVYLAREERHRWLRVTLWAAFSLTVLAILFTYSRGGVLGLVVVLALLFLKARSRLALTPVVAVALVAFTWFAPERWVTRMETVQTYDQDTSAQLRLMSWRVGWEIARDYPVTGGGFLVFTHRATYDRYMPEYPRSFSSEAHSIYFNLLGEHGWIGFGLFALLVLFVLNTLRRLRKLHREHKELAWISNYAHMLQVSIVAYLVTGIFLSVAYFDLAYQLFALAAILKAVAAREVAAHPKPVPAGRPAFRGRQPLPARLR